MNKSIIVGLVALGLTACGGDVVEDQPTDAVTAEAPAVEVVEDAAAEEVPAEGVSSTVGAMEDGRDAPQFVDGEAVNIP